MRSEKSSCRHPILDYANEHTAHTNDAKARPSPALGWYCQTPANDFVCERNTDSLTPDQKLPNTIASGSDSADVFTGACRWNDRAKLRLGVVCGRQPVSMIGARVGP
eukprot:m.1077826 g.1077826  ORF g.1077826 m.1077826 type:complete len:107 (+) comp24252_c0_seq1:3351-3671(+)